MSILCSMVGASFATVAAVVEVLRSKKGITAIGNAQVSTAQSQFGGASLLLDGTGDYLKIIELPAFGTGDFTVEFWYRPAAGGDRLIWDQRVDSNNDALVIYTGSSNSFVFVNGSNRITASPPTTNTQTHIAVSRSSGSTKMFFNGTQVGSTYTDTTNYTATKAHLGAEAPSGNYGVNGYIDEVRVSKTARYTAAFTAPTQPFVNDDNTVLLIHANGTNGSTFFEDDNGSRAPTGLIATGAAKVSTTQSKFGGSSANFDGTSNTQILGRGWNTSSYSGDFTIEGWFYITDKTTSSNARIWSDGDGGTTEDYRLLQFEYSTNQIYMVTGQSGNDSWGYSYVSATLNINTWYHIAASRSGSSLRIFVNGTQQGSTISNSLAFTTASANGSFRLGMFRTDASRYRGFIDDFRISNSARYTANFTAPTSPFVNDANTLMLIHGDGTDASTVFRDDNGIQGAAPKTLAASGNAQLSTAQYKFGTSSLLLDGNGDYLTVTNAQDLNFQKNDFTIEAWVRFDALATSNRHTLISNGVSSFTTGWIKFAAADLGAAYYPQVTAYDYSSGGSPMMTSSTAVSNNTWYHIAWVRSSTNHYLYLDGVQVASNTNSTAQGINVNMNLSGTQIGRYSFDNGTPPSATYMDGYIDEMRVSNIARYTAAFTPSTTAFTQDSNTLLLLHMDGANASTTFRDDAGRTQKGVQANGNAQVSTAQSKFGGSSALFDGAGDALTISETAPFNFGTGNFTIEFWIYKTSYTGADFFVIEGASDLAANIYYYYGSSYGMYLYHAGNAQILTNTTAFTANAWHHVALVKNNSVTRFYVNGTQQGSDYNDTTSYSFPNGIRIADENGGLGRDFSGYLDEIRISNSARYTANFTPTTTPFQNDDNTILLLHCDGTNASTVFPDDNGAKPYTL